MSTMLVEVYDALKEAGTSEEKARAAATSLTARDERRFNEIDQRFQRLEEKVAALDAKVIALAQDVAVIRAELGPVKWMHGITLSGVLALLIKTFFG